ncbi:hypothetical protein SKAU_G00034200 [Synaphobranchus kaupii]|uniref:Uncharacterized protein n=1 Tax=Synaphobranchus kaupii TaxID=118154 RepID=A0A9Q1GEX2_SYNKA|nr:hypothetical protein SKAU_G00034200 [Synaphobranchus kaupii]
MSGWRNRPSVPSTQTSTNTQRKILSMTMATYFQSSATYAAVARAPEPVPRGEEMEGGKTRITQGTAENRRERNNEIWAEGREKEVVNEAGHCQPPPIS